MLFPRAKQAKGGKQKKSYKRVKTQKLNDFWMVWTSVLWYKTININNRNTTKILILAPMLHPAAFLFTWVLLFSCQCLQIKLIQCKISLLTSPPFSFLSFFFCPESIPWSDSSCGPISCWVSTTEVGMLYSDGRSEH